MRKPHAFWPVPAIPFQFLPLFEKLSPQDQFSRVESLEKIFPPPKPDLWTRLLPTQRKLLFTQQGLIVLVLVANIVVSIVGSTKFDIDTTGTFGTLYVGQCDVAQNLNLWFHLLINILSTLLLGASNYAMQLLASPTRNDVDRAHARGVYLDIGISSVRNLRYVGRKKAAMWWTLGVCSTCLHLL
jgi:hypothetical protein